MVTLAQSSNDEWHLAVLTYDGQVNITAEQFASLNLFIDCIPARGNSQRDEGKNKLVLFFVMFFVFVFLFI